MSLVAARNGISNVIADGAGLATVEFTPKGFETADLITVSASCQYVGGGFGQAAKVLTLNNITESSFDVTVVGPTGAPVSGTVQIAWTAIQDS